jgi:EAL domain-containing protein (putative c-di-GMP-specific phosphodiesterase class I)
MMDLKKMGIELSLDDFGTGYSSLNYLRRLPINTLKIDRSFVVDAAVTGEGAAIAKSIIALARNLNLNVLAEGAETEKEYAFLMENECDELQGYYFSRPLGDIAFKKFVLENRGMDAK